MDSQAASRLSGIDSFRVFGVLGVVFIHVTHVGAAGTALDLASRWAVPFFFVAAGYFMSSKPILEAIQTLAIRLALPFAFWAVVYLLFSDNARETLASAKGMAILMIAGGPGYHLWYLPSLGVCATLLLSLRRLNSVQIMWIAAGLYLLGLVFGPYSGLIFGVRNDIWNMRVGPFFGSLFMATGLAYRRWGGVPRLALGVIMFVIGGLVQAAEAVWLTSIGSAKKLDMFVGTVPFGVGAFIIALHFHGMLANRLAALGRISLGIYASHLLGLWIAYRFITVDGIGAALLASALAFSFAIGISLVLSRWSVTRRLVA